jgi:peptidoglycan/xylan/chitin deacetylase (PgdA/CDA1 family)
MSSAKRGVGQADSAIRGEKVVALAVILVVAVSFVAYLAWRRMWGYPPPSFPRVLAYHKVTGFESGVTWISPDRFIAQMDRLLESEYRFIDEGAFLDTLSGIRECDGRELLLTFDDGYRELLERAMPALEERRIPALIFILSSFVGMDNEWELGFPGRRCTHLSWDEISELAGRGFSFGSHTCTHRDLTRLKPCEVRDEARIEEMLGRPVRTLSYPFGRFNDLISREAALAGYAAAFSMYPPGPNRKIDRYALRREAVYVVDTVFNLKWKIGCGPLFWIEDMKGRAFNRIAVLTPILKRY